MGRRYADLLFTVGASLLLVAVVLVVPSASAVRIIFGIPFVLLFPGYVLIAALLPRKGALDAVERIALSLGLSIAIVPLIGLALNYSPWGIRLDPILAFLTLFIMLAAAAAAYRRRLLPEDEAFGIAINLRLPKRSESRLPHRLLAAGFAASLVVLGIAAYFTFTSGGSSESFTEFYVLGPGGKAEDYPSVIMLGDDADVIVGVVNREGADTTYGIEVRINGEATDTFRDVQLAEGDAWEKRIAIVPAHVGPDQKVGFLLYREGAGDPYRNLHLFIDVEAAVADSVSPPQESPSPTPSPTPTPEPAATNGAPDGFIYLVQTGDTLATLSERFGLDNDTIASANGLEASASILPGTELLIRGVPYVVQPGDTLADIAAVFDVSLAAIVAANDFEDASKISAGQEIVIPKD